MAFHYKVISIRDFYPYIREEHKFRLERFFKEVSDHLNDGWILQGGVAVRHFDGMEYIDYSQAIYKEVK